MAITMNGQTFRTLGDALYLNGNRIIGAYANDTLVYPDNTPSVIKYASAHTADTTARWDGYPQDYNNRYCSSFSGKLLVASLFPTFATGQYPLIGFNRSGDISHARYCPMAWMTYLSPDIALHDGEHGADINTCVQTHSEIAMQCTADFNWNGGTSYLYTNSISALSSQLASGITLHFDYHEGIVDLSNVYTRSDIITADPREAILGSCVETYRGSTYTSTYGIQICVGRVVTSNTSSVDNNYAYYYVAPWFAVSAVFKTANNSVSIPIGTFFIDKVLYPNVRYVRTTSRWTGGDLNLSYYNHTSSRTYTDTYYIREFSRWPTISDADYHAPIAELGSLT